MKLDGAKDAKNNEAEFFREIVILEKGLKTHQKKKKKKKNKKKKKCLEIIWLFSYDSKYSQQTKLQNFLSINIFERISILVLLHEVKFQEKVAFEK